MNSPLGGPGESTRTCSVESAGAVVACGEPLRFSSCDEPVSVWEREMMDRSCLTSSDRSSSLLDVCQYCQQRQAFPGLDWAGLGAGITHALLLMRLKSESISQTSEFLAHLIHLAPLSSPSHLSW